MAVPSIPQSLQISQGNQTILVTWDMSVGATSYDIQRSADNITFASIGTSTLPEYLDSTPTLGVMYWYKVASVNSDGTSSYSNVVQMVAAPNAEMSLYELRLRCKQKADRIESDFVTQTEWNFFIDQAMYELYDMLITLYEDYFQAPEVLFTVNGSSSSYPLPNGTISFTDSDTGSAIVAPPFYKLLGIDLAVNTINNAYVTVNKYNLIDRNRFVYPNTASTIYGVFNLRYRVMGTNIRFIPTPSGNQQIRILYAPRLTQLLKDTDLTTIGFSGWLQYVIIRAAKYALDKEESDTAKLTEELAFLTTRINGSAINRDAGQPDRISDTRGSNWSGWGGNGCGDGYQGGP